MSLVLTDQEIRDALNQGHIKLVPNTRAITRAQLRKVVAWLRERTYGLAEPDETITYRTVYEEGEWEELLKEML